MVSDLSVFDFQDYKKFLNAWLSSPVRQEKGLRLRLARLLGCQPAYISHVLNGSAHLSPDQAFAAQNFLNLSVLESRYFMNLVHLGRAASPELRAQLRDDNKKIFEQYSDLQPKIKSFSLKDVELQQVFYSSWHHGALHMALLLKRSSSVVTLADLLGIPPSKVEESLRFLLDAGMAKKNRNGEYSHTQTHIHLPPDSPFIKQHHTNWRLKNLAELDSPRKTNFHYSSVIAISEKDFVKLKQVMTATIESMRKTISESSPEDSVFAYSLDLFKISK